MSSRIAELKKKDLINPPKWLPDNTVYETVMGSMAYGVNRDDSDMDVYGFCLPPKDLVFPHLAGEIPGFGTQVQRFEQYQQHHVMDASTKREYDFTIYSIVKYFQLCMENNPNMIDSLFTPRNCVLHSTEIAEHVRANRRLFLHKGSWHKFKGYAYAQLSKMDRGANRASEKRQESIEKYGYDVKFAYHVVRLINEVEQILVDHDLDLQKNNEQLKSIRKGEWSLTELRDWFNAKERSLEEIYLQSTLRNKPDEAKIKSILLECMEMHYGSLDAAVKTEKNYEAMGREIRDILERYSV